MPSSSSDQPSVRRNAAIRRRRSRSQQRAPRRISSSSSSQGEPETPGVIRACEPVYQPQVPGWPRSSESVSGNISPVTRYPPVAPNIEVHPNYFVSLWFASSLSPVKYISTQTSENLFYPSDPNYCLWPNNILIPIILS
jgi:hypothetical protein